MKTKSKIKIPRNEIADKIFSELQDYDCIKIIDAIIDHKGFLKKEIPSPYISELSHEVLENFYVWSRIIEEISQKKTKESYLQLIMRALGAEYCGYLENIISIITKEIKENVCSDV